MDILILAAGRCTPDLQEFSGLEWRADLPYKGKKMVEIVLDATAPFGEPVIVGPQSFSRSRTVAPGNSFVQSLANGLHEINSETFLLATADLPFITADAVEDYLEHSDPKLLLNYPVIPMELAERDYPGMKRTSLKLREGSFTGGNISLINTAMMRHSLPKLEQAYANRKSPLRLGQQVGFGTLVRLILNRVVPSSVSLRQLETDVSRFLGGEVRAVQTQHPSIGADIDNLEQYQALLALKG
ncbi:MAG: NTP transferase domain-containing protein [Armatimonadetes bacterium]|nr:NTP transferase domain-containing protein [Armatimonadota bacterium]